MSSLLNTIITFS